MDYDPDYRGMARYLRLSPELGHLLADAAGRGVDAASAAAPVDTGSYVSSLRAEDGGIVKPGNLAARQSARVVADGTITDHAIFVELRDHPLQAAIDAIEGPGA